MLVDFGFWEDWFKYKLFFYQVFNSKVKILFICLHCAISDFYLFLIGTIFAKSAFSAFIAFNYNFKQVMKKQHFLTLIAVMLSSAVFAQPTHVITDDEKDYKTAKEFIAKEQYAFALSLVFK